MSDMPPFLFDKVPDRLPAQQASDLCCPMVQLLSLDYHSSPSGSFSNKSFCSNGILPMDHPLSPGSTLKAWLEHPDDLRYTDQVDSPLMSHLPGHEEAHILSFNSGVVLFEVDGFRVDLFGLFPLSKLVEVEVHVFGNYLRFVDAS
jgi:hypothetical protein